MEIWKTIPGLPSIYEASSEGKIRRLQNTRPLISRWGGHIICKRYPKKVLVCQKPSKKGYLRHRINHKTHFAHRLIAITFIENVKNAPQVNHKNGIKTDNRADNLEWVTNMENRTHAVINGLVAEGERCGNAKLNIESIAEIRKLYANGVSQKKIANNYGIIQQTVSVIVRYKSWKKCA
jgi:hypothetical protein